jgi:5-(carboxyamino)imidazole ribonucleotide mutase
MAARSRSAASPLVGIVMGSESDHETLARAEEILRELGVPFETSVLSAHRTPEETFAYAREAEGRGLRVLIAGAGAAAALPGVIAALTPLPVLGVPVESRALGGIDSLLSIVQMPAGVPTATFAIGGSGAANAALFAARILALGDAAVGRALERYRKAGAKKVLDANTRMRTR